MITRTEAPKQFIVRRTKPAVGKPRKADQAASTKMVTYHFCMMCSSPKQPDYDELCADCIAGCEQRRKDIDDQKRLLGEFPEPREPGPRFVEPSWSASVTVKNRRHDAERCE